MPYFAGQAIKLANYSGPATSPAGGYLNLSGALYDPATPTLRYLLPGDTAQTASGGALTKDAIGLYHLVVTPSKPGTLVYAWSSNDGAYAASELRVEPAPL